MVKIEEGGDKAGHVKMSIMFKEQVGFENQEIKHDTTLYRGAKSVVTMLNHDEDVCNMHGCDKIGQ